MNASIIQGSGIGPPSYVVEASDLHPRHNQNAMTKFADDTYLLVGSNCITTIADEIANMKDWAARNNMRIHPTKTKELVICRTGFRLPPSRQLHPALSSRERNVSTPSGSWEFSSTRSYRWETTSQKFLTPAPLPHMRCDSCDLTASSPMSSISLLEPPLLLPFFMPRLHGMDLQIKLIASVSSASLLGCDIVDICLRTFHVSPLSLMRRIENSSGPYLKTLHTSYAIISSTSMNLVIPFVLEYITIRTLSHVPP